MTTNLSLLRISFINPSGCTAPHKKEALQSLVKQEESDALGIAETHIVEGREALFQIEGTIHITRHTHPRGLLTFTYAGFRCFFNGLAGYKENSNEGELNPHKWGVALYLRKNLRIGEIIRPKGLLKARVIMASIFIETTEETKPIWIACIYAPVNEEDHHAFFEELSTLWEDHNLNGQNMIVTGDFNNRILNSIQ